MIYVTHLPPFRHFRNYALTITLHRHLQVELYEVVYEEFNVDDAGTDIKEEEKGKRKDKQDDDLDIHGDTKSLIYRWLQSFSIYVKILFLNYLTIVG